MPNILSNGIAWLNARRVDHLSEIVDYSRDGHPPQSLAAAIGQTTRELIDESGQTIEATSVDFLVSSASLILSGAVVAPLIGDRIQVTDSGVVKTFEVLDLAGLGHYRWSDPRGLVLRIHTKLIGSG